MHESGCSVAYLLAREGLGVGTAVQLGLPQWVDVAVVGSGAARLVAGTLRCCGRKHGPGRRFGTAGWRYRRSFRWRGMGGEAWSCVSRTGGERQRRARAALLLGEGRDTKLELDLVDAFLAGPRRWRAS